MARDKLITVRIEGDKRQAFGDLAKSQNTDTASLLYDFISGCLGGKIDISLVTGKGNRIDKIDNQLDSDRLDKLETTSQRLDERLGIIAKKLNDWIEAFDDRLTDSDQGLSEKITSLENRLNALASQLDSQRIGRIDTDSQQDRQGENPDMGTVTPEVSPSPPSPPGTDAIASIDGTVESVEPNSSIETVAIEDSEKKIPLPDISIASPIETVESGSESISSINEPDTDAIATVRGDTDSSIETVTSAYQPSSDSKPWYTIDELLDCHYPGWPETKEGLRKKALREHWPKRTRRGSKGNPYEYQAVLPE